MAQDPPKVSTRTILALIQAKELCAAADELRKLEPIGKSVYGYDRLVAAIRGPMAKADALFSEALALVPDIAGSAEGDAATRGTRIRGAIRQLMKARAIVRDDAGINDLLKRCLATLQEAENKVSVAQGLAMRGDWAAAYKEIKAAAELDDSPDVQETRKLIAKHYKVQATDAQHIQKTWRTAKIGAAALVAAVVAVLMIQCHFQSGVDAVRREEAAKKRKLLRSVGASVPPPAPALSQGRPEQAPKPAVPPQVAPAAEPAADAPPSAEPAVAADLSAEKPFDIQADAPTGTALGDLPPGTKITLRYKSGVWMPWRAKVGFSPDAPAEAGKRHSLAIRGLRSDGTPKTLQVVPFATKDAPFTYEVIGKYASLSLVINDDDGNFDNNDGTVTYEVRVVKP